MISREQFRTVCGRYATGITVATVLEGGERPHGVTVNSFTSVSLDPPLILFCLDKRAAILAHFQAAGKFAINILSEDQQEISSRFASRGVDRFDSVEWAAGETGVPVLPGTLGVMECTLAQAVAAGDHVILLGEVRHVRVAEGKPLLYFGSGYRKIEMPLADHAQAG